MKKIIALLCMLVLLLSVGCSGKTLNVGQPDGTIVSNNGMAVQQGDYVYFINGGMPETLGGALKEDNRSVIYRMKSDGSDLQAVPTNKAFSLHIFEDRIFYLTPTNEAVQLRSVRLDGTNDKKLLTLYDKDFVEYGENGVAVGTQSQIIYLEYASGKKHTYHTGLTSGIKISDHYIYYYYSGTAGTKRIEIDGGHIETISENNGPFLYADDTDVYFATARAPYHVNANTMEETQISEALYQSMIFNKKNHAIIGIASSDEDAGLYFQPSDNVAGREIGENGNKMRYKLHNKTVSAYCLTDDYIFFVEAENGNVYRTTYTGADKILLGNIVSALDADAVEVMGNLIFAWDNVESGLAYMGSIDGTVQLKRIVK